MANIKSFIKKERGWLLYFSILALIAMLSTLFDDPSSIFIVFMLFAFIPPFIAIIYFTYKE